MSLQSTRTAKMQYLNLNGEDLVQVVGQGGNVQFVITANGGFQVVPQVISASGALNPFVGGTYVITKAGVAALTLAAPTVTIDDGNEISISSSTNNAHTVTATGLLLTGAITVNVATWPAPASGGGGSLTLMAYQGKWIVQSQQNIAFS